MGNMITGIISISVGAVLLATVFITTVHGTNQTGTRVLNTTTSHYDCANLINCSYPNAWTTSEIAMWGLLALIGIVGMVYGVLNVFGLA